MKNVGNTLKLVVWLWLLPPLGIYFLYRESELTKYAKWRVFLYAFLVPVLGYFAFGLWKTNQALQALP